MSVKVLSESVRELVDEDAEVEQIATGFAFTEGPIWMADGSLHFSDMPGDKRRRWHPVEGVQVLRDPSNKCNGMTRDNDGNLIVCEHVTSSVVRESPDGTRETIATHWGDKELNSPNDVIVASRRLDHLHRPHLRPDAGVRARARPGPRLPGRLSPPRGRGDLQLLIDDFAQPNGLCFTADESLLYINDTVRAHIRVFDVGPDHALSNGRVFAEEIGTGDLARGELVDGMKLDERGNVYVTGPKGVWIFAPDGEHLGVIEVPENVGNVNWGDDDWRSLFIPASTSVYRVRMKVAGNQARLHEIGGAPWTASTRSRPHWSSRTCRTT